MADVVLHVPVWVEDNTRSSDKYIVFRCERCSNNVKFIDRKEYKNGKGKLPPTEKHFPH